MNRAPPNPVPNPDTHNEAGARRLTGSTLNGHSGYSTVARNAERKSFVGRRVLIEDLDAHVSPIGDEQP